MREKTIAPVRVSGAAGERAGAALPVPAFIQVRAAAKEYAAQGRGGEPVVALAHVDLAVPRGAFVSLVGPSGCGKSTLLQAMAGLLPLSGGRVVIDGEDVRGPDPRLLYVFQQYGKSLFPWRTVEDNVAFGLENKGLSRRERASRCAQYLGRVGLTGTERRYPWQLSGGMQQRVAIARALAAQPEILLMDEPFSAVDALTRTLLQDLLLGLWQELRLTIVFVTHDIDEAIYLSDRVAVFSQAPGRILEDRVVDLPRPRHQTGTRSDREYLRQRNAIFNLIIDVQQAIERGGG